MWKKNISVVFNYINSSSFYPSVFFCPISSTRTNQLKAPTKFIQVGNSPTKTRWGWGLKAHRFDTIVYGLAYVIYFSGIDLCLKKACAVVPIENMNTIFLVTSFDRMEKAHVHRRKFHSSRIHLIPSPSCYNFIHNISDTMTPPNPHTHANLQILSLTTFLPSCDLFPSLFNTSHTLYPSFKPQYIYRGKWWKTGAAAPKQFSY